MEQTKQNTALLVMDMQAGILGRYPAAAQLTANVAKAVAFARRINMEVIYVIVGFRQGAREIISPINIKSHEKSFVFIDNYFNISSLKNNMRLMSFKNV